MSKEIDEELLLLQKQIEKEGINYIPNMFSLPKRANRGNKLEYLMENEDNLEEDDFWKQDKFKEEENDIEFVDTENQEDEADSDFDEPEEQVDEKEEEEGKKMDNILKQEEKKELKAQKRAYVDPLLSKKSAKTTHNSSISLLNAVENAMEGKQLANDKDTVKQKEKPAKKKAKITTPPKLGVHLRASTKSIVAKCEAQRKELNEIKELNKTRRPRKKRIVKQMTQTQRLAEAKKTEKQNIDDLERMIKEFEAKKAAENIALKKQTIKGPIITFKSEKMILKGRPVEKNYYLYSDPETVPVVPTAPKSFKSTSPSQLLLISVNNAHNQLKAALEFINGVVSTPSILETSVGIIHKIPSDLSKSDLVQKSVIKSEKSTKLYSVSEAFKNSKTVTKQESANVQVQHFHPQPQIIQGYTSQVSVRQLPQMQSHNVNIQMQQMNCYANPHLVQSVFSVQQAPMPYQSYNIVPNMPASFQHLTIQNK